MLSLILYIILNENIFFVSGIFSYYIFKDFSL